MHQKDLQPRFPPQTITSRRGITAYKHLSSSITHPSTHASTSYGRSSVTPKFRFCVCKTASERSHEDEGFRFLINGLQFKIAAVLNVLSKNYSTQRPILSFFFTSERRHSHITYFIIRGGNVQGGGMSYTRSYHTIVT